MRLKLHYCCSNSPIPSSTIRELEREELAASGGAALTASVGNLSLKEGEKIKINIGGVVSHAYITQFHTYT
jgi:hypothetical protein